MKFKTSLSVFMAAMMAFGCTAFGGALSVTRPANPNAIEVIVEDKKEEKPSRVITYDEAVELAIKNNSTLKELEDNLEVLEDNQEQVGYALGLQTLPGVPSSGTTFLDSTTATLLTTLNTIETSIKTVGYSKKMTEESCRLMVKSYMAEIVKGEKNIEMMDVNLEISRQNTYFMRLKYDMGMISLNEFNAAINDNKTTEYTHQLTKLALDAAYNNLGRFIGVKEKFAVDYSVTYEPYPYQADISNFANRIVNADPSLKIAEGNVNDAEFSMIYVAMDNGASYDERNRNLESAGRKYNDTRNDLLLAVKNGYATVKQAEGNIETLRMKVENTKAQYETAKLSHSMGYLTDIELMGAGLALTAAENDLTAAIFAHDMAKFLLERPYLNTASSSAQKQG